MTRQTYSTLMVLLWVFIATPLFAKFLTWQFPLPRTHTGMLLGNGVQGLMVWGTEQQLNITVGRAGFWDHRGGYKFSTNTTYQEVRKMLEANDEVGLHQAFAYETKPEGIPNRPYQIGGGRLEIDIPTEWKMVYATLDLETAKLSIRLMKETNVITFNNTTKEYATIEIQQSVFDELAWIHLPGAIHKNVKLRLIPSYDHPNVKARLASFGVQPPEIWQDDKQEIHGFCQHLPDDDALTVCYRHDKKRILISSALGEDSIARARRRLDIKNVDELGKSSARWWQAFWSSVPVVQIPDPVLQEIYDYGVYKMGCCHPPFGVACTLQGPFLEEYQLPPWSADYHFNINIEMIYWPVLATNRLSHLKPLWDMLMHWLPQMKANGEQFFGRKGALMLPHAVDDRCQVVGQFWTGTIDQACAAWMAQLAWLHYRYSMDETVLRDIAWPLMKGAFEGYWGMTEAIEDENGTRLSLPVSVSPEFKGSRMDAWGRDASFQLAAYQMTAMNLQKAAAILDETVDPRWKQVLDELPPYTTVEASRRQDNPENKDKRIALWEGMDLIESHRHHSHLAAIYPFATISIDDPEHSQIIRNSIYHWMRTGAGAWSGWCVPWAATINARCGRTDAAVSWLHYWKQNFTNIGRGTLHDADFPGISAIGSRNWNEVPFGEPHREKMQLDAGFGALDAVLQILVQQRGDVIYVLPHIPREWRECYFERIRTEGAFQVSAWVKNYKKQKIVVKCNADGPLKLAHGLGGNYLLNGTRAAGEILVKDCMKGDELILERIIQQ